MFLQKRSEVVRLLVSEDRLKNMTVEDLLHFEALSASTQGEDVPFKFTAAVNCVAHFMVDEEQKPLPKRQAMQALKRLTLPELKEAISSLGDAFNTIQGAAVPNGQSGDSTA